MAMQPAVFRVSQQRLQPCGQCAACRAAAAPAAPAEALPVAAEAESTAHGDTFRAALWTLRRPELQVRTQGPHTEPPDPWADGLQALGGNRV